MVFLFKDKSIGSIFFLVALCCAVHAHLFIHPPVIAITEDSGIISYTLEHYFTNAFPSLATCLYIAIVLIQAIRLNLLLNDLRMYSTAGFTTALTYVLLTAILPQWSYISPALIANSFVIWIFIFLSRLYNNPNPRSLLFNTGLVVGISFLCYHPTAILIAVVLFALAVVRPFILSEWFVLLLGILMPIYVFLSLLFLNDNMPIFVTMLPHLSLHLPVGHTDVWVWVKLMTMVLMLFVGLQYWSVQNNRMVIQIRKNWSAMLVMLVIILPIPFIFKGVGLDSAILCLVPLASFIGNAYLYPKKMLLPNIMFWLCIVLVIHTNWVMGVGN
ncbi:hypothetical protein [Parasediminibacterium sp. JCM 36343]|uniref:hypothetical protein n=1 Tax=Parasediminibacterium sp. JCM 36343 TaxID=3374279 RepID=UPI00397C0899